MANFYEDNKDIQWYVDTWIDWEKVLSYTELGQSEYASTAEAVEFYRDILNLIGGFAANEIAPYTAELDRHEPELVDGEVVFPERLQGIFDQLRGLGVHGMSIPRELGGMNCPLLLYMMSNELFSRADASVMTHHGFHGGIATSLLAYSMNEGTAEIDRETRTIKSTRFDKEIADIIDGEDWGSMDITEPDAGSDMGALKCRAEQDKDGNWLVTGQKIFITSGHGRYHIVIARTEEAGDGPMGGLEGLSTFLVPAFTRKDDGSKEWHARVERLEEKIGHHASATVTISFDRTPAHLIGERGEGFKHMLVLMNGARISVGFEALGVCEAAHRMAAAYAAQRPSMGKNIDRHEMIADYLDEMRTDIVGIRALAVAAATREEAAQRMEFKARYLMDEGSEEHRALLQEIKRTKWKGRLATPLLKYIASEKAVEMARRNLQIHGGCGYTTEYGAEKLLRDALVLPIYEGTSQIQALMAMKDNLLGIMKDPKRFVQKKAALRWRATTTRDPLERSVVNLRRNAMAAQQALMVRIAGEKFAETRAHPVKSWKAQMSDWDPKRDFGPAMLHAERLTRILVDAAIGEALWEQAEKYPERREILEAYVERAEPRSRYLLDEIKHTGDRLLHTLVGPDQGGESAEAAK